VEWTERADLLNLDRSLAAEWTLTNRVGTYAAGTALGARTRPQHGLLSVPDGERRRLLLAKVDEEVELADGERIALGCNEYHDGTIHPLGHLWLEAARPEAPAPAWRWRAREVTIEKTVSLASSRGAVVVRYRVVRAPGPVRLRLTPLMVQRDADELTTGAWDWRFGVETHPGGCSVRAWPDATMVGLAAWSSEGRRRVPALVVETGHWYWRFLLRHERWFGRAHVEDLHAPCVVDYLLHPGECAYLAVGAEADPAELLAARPERWLPRDA